MSGFADILFAFCAAFTGRLSYKQEALVADFLGTAYNAHDATEDISSLLRLTRKLTLEQLSAVTDTASSPLTCIVS